MLHGQFVHVDRREVLTSSKRRRGFRRHNAKRARLVFMDPSAYWTSLPKRQSEQRTLLSVSMTVCLLTLVLEMTMGMGFPMGMGIPWDSHGNGNWWQNWEWE